MTPEQKLLLENLLDRLDADAQSDQPQFRSIVSDREREAIRSLVSDPNAETPPPEPPEPPEEEPPEPPEEEEIGTGEQNGRDPIALNARALDYEASPRPEWTLCLDFGTAKSKAFAATNTEAPDLLALPIGKADGDIDGSVHDVSSSVWIDDDGLLFVGSQAVKNGIDYRHSTRRRLDSLKQEISQLHPESDQAQLKRKLPKEVDPTLTLTYSDVIILYLAYLTDLATTELEEQVGTRYVRRRFTLPWWNEAQRKWTGKFFAEGLMRAQLLADTFNGKWTSGVHVDQVKRILRDAVAPAKQLTWLVLTEPEGGVLEALAAASARVWSDRYARNVMVVVDVGAGTTDISVLWVVQGTPPARVQVQSPEELKSRDAWPIEPCGTAIRQAGDTLDSLLVAELMRKANLGADVALKQRVSDSLYRKSVRRLKETLFNTGEITEKLVSDHIVNLTKEEFMNLEGVRVFEQRIRDTIEELLGGVHQSWVEAARHGITIILTGGGSSLPMIRNLANKRWKIGNREVKCRLAIDVPSYVTESFESDFIQEYPRLSVAMGGALKMLLDEHDTLDEWYGATPPRRRTINGSTWT